MTDVQGGTGFRDDINGMRAIAVLGVVAYHFQLAGLQGGFVGVDVFFVISGFLMTQIIAGRLAANRFTFAAFYAARIRRIVPALVVMVSSVTLLGFVLLDPLKLTVLAQDAATSLLFASNILYIGQGGYFAFAAEENWLLHTWSLSVEWQFYILYPLLLWALHRWARTPRATVLSLAAIGALSFAKMVANSLAGGSALTFAFYLLHTRAWEFLVGALCVYARPHLRWSDGLRSGAHAAGVVLVLASMALLQSRTAVWPSAWAAAPATGAALILLAERQTAFWARFAPVAAIGRWSYSIYLWHWPLAAMSSFFGFAALGVRAPLALLSIGLGALSYAQIERGLADAIWRRPRRAWRLGLPAYLLAFLLPIAALATDGLESARFAFRPDVLAELRDYRAAETDFMSPERDCGSYVRVSNIFNICRFGDPKARDTLVIGDSFGEQLVPRYRGELKDSPIGITFVLRGGCIPMPGTERIPAGSNCERWVREAYGYAERENFRRVVFVAFWNNYDRSRLCLLDVADCGAKLSDEAFDAALDAGYQRMASAWKRLRAQGKEVVVLEEPPFGNGDPSDLYKQAVAGAPTETLRVPRAEFEQERTASKARLEAAARSAGATVVDPAAALCPNDVCSFVENGHTLYKDGYHLRASVMKAARFAIYDQVFLPAEKGRSSSN